MELDLEAARNLIAIASGLLALGVQIWSLIQKMPPVIWS
jgi:hypothetical protein